MKHAKLALMVVMCLLAGCSTTSKTTTQKTVRAYNGTASVGDFLTISIDSSTLMITYKNYTNGETGTVPYVVNSDGTYTITDPNGNLLSAYEVPGTALMVEAANAGTLQNTKALITAVESAPASINTFAGGNFNYIQFRTSTGGIEIGTVSVDSSGNITHGGYWPFGVISQGNMFNSGYFPASSVTEDASGNFFVINENDGSQDTVFGTQNGLFAVDTGAGAILSQPKASSKSFVASNAGTYKAVYYEKSNAQMGQNNAESGTPAEGQATVTVGSGGTVTITDSNNTQMASGTLQAIADTSYIYDGTQNTLSDPLYGMFTFRTSGSVQQDVFVTFESGAIIFSSFQTAMPLQQNAPYTYFYGVGMK
ncbi:MAG TPA: hypothetical protein VMH04_22085 [Candidatus Solibacter sp.]|nr:hypothetical protein [Candidatus Solibacter sp.]